MLGQRVGGVLVGEGPRDDVALRKSPAAQRGLQLRDAVLAQQWAVDLPTDEDVPQLGQRGGYVGAVDDLPVGALGQGEVVGQLGIREDHDVVPARSFQRNRAGDMSCH